MTSLPQDDKGRNGLKEMWNLNVLEGVLLVILKTISDIVGGRVEEGWGWMKRVSRDGGRSWKGASEMDLVLAGVSWSAAQL